MASWLFTIAMPLTIALSIALTPVLWKLEPVLGIELAGHSGPSDWVIGLILGLSAAGLFWGLLKVWPIRVEKPTA